MPFFLQKWIYRSDLKKNPNDIYVFGDNLQRIGMGGQAAEMRYEPNAFGIPTKRDPGHTEGSYFGDFENLAEESKCIHQHFTWLEQLLKDGRTVVFPEDGIGTGLSELPRRAPHINALIEWWVDYLRKTFPYPTEGKDETTINRE